MKFPVFVKPTDGGSSFGITKVKKPEDLPEAIRFAFSEGSDSNNRARNRGARIHLRGIFQRERS
jgi:D-alanine-D-alanine ligase-like ATP-grasp enzyme